MLRIGQVEPSATADGKYTDGSVAGGIAATRLRAAAFNAMQEELANIVESAGMILSPDDMTQVLTALKKQLLSRANPFADIKADGPAAVAAALSNLGLKEAAKRAVGTGAGQIPDMSAFEYVGNATAGYLKLPNGFKLQWLETPAKVPASSTGVGYWTYPFSVCLFAIAVPVAVTPSQVAGNVVAGVFSDAAVELHNWGPISAAARILGVGR